MPFLLHLPSLLFLFFPIFRSPHSPDLVSLAGGLRQSFGHWQFCCSFAYANVTDVVTNCTVFQRFWYNEVFEIGLSRMFLQQFQ